jgi:hypothetical protein
VAELKTQKTDASVEEFLRGVADEQQREDAFRVLKLMREVTGEAPAMWGGSIVGFGNYRCKYESGREVDWFLTGFAPRKGNLTLYLMPGLDQLAPLLKKLGKHKTGKGCLYIKRLADIDWPTLGELIRGSVAHLRAGQKQQKEPDRSRGDNK